ncbi:hypothetical protein BDP55DRAFT_733650 [Colletotrichum godetiae]|uniref:RING-type domain-containing protein n=1 Tax=Colletotrichum godetiae TaxID=1209918 RepID=A0AAJ0A9F9_9PEZI|nr:uncharacterized protein BDP55DRAFT_733650 [Colletotrichum godetiae]KAK1658986.1 hypothetical protein BDP55DRAFT_733650 [Colletotrichum godetiae]
MEAVDCDKDACAATVLSVFPDICLRYLEETAAKVNHNPDQTIDTILGSAEKGGSYPKASRQKNLKRKREGSAEDDEKANILRLYAYPGREREVEARYIDKSEQILKHDFPQVLQKCLAKVFFDHDNQLLPTYLRIDQAVEDLKKGVRDGLPPGFALKKKSTPPSERIFEGERLDHLMRTANPVEKRALDELVAARQVLEATKTSKEAARLEAAREAENFETAKALGTVLDCGCCYGEFAFNRMVCCEKGTHFFCVDCARRNAETVVGLSKYEITCMSTDGCDAGFSYKERAKFINEQLTQALDRIESEANLRMAGIDGLETCPFCPYAAEYPPVESNREFKCENPDCHVVSCRLCREETHIPRTCEEAASDSTEGARRQIEEAMSTALIRKCNKCGMAFVKESGCNKMTCPKRGCRNIQCYVCSKSCDYTHFDDKTRGGKKGNCPLFDDVNMRHNEEVQHAEAQARQGILERHPLMKAKENLLKVNSGVPVAPAVPKENRLEARAAQEWAEVDAMIERHDLEARPFHRPNVQPGIVQPVPGIPYQWTPAGIYQPMPQPQAHPFVAPGVVAAEVQNPWFHLGPPNYAYLHGHNYMMLDQQHGPVVGPGPGFGIPQDPRGPYLGQNHAPPAAPQLVGSAVPMAAPQPAVQPVPGIAPGIAPHPPAVQAVPVIPPPDQARLDNPNNLGFEDEWGPEHGEPRELKRQKFLNKGAERPDLQNMIDKARGQRARQQAEHQSRHLMGDHFEAVPVPEDNDFFGTRLRRLGGPVQPAMADLPAARLGAGPGSGPRLGVGPRVAVGSNGGARFGVGPNGGLARFVASIKDRDGPQAQNPALMSQATQRAFDTGNELRQRLALERGGASGSPGRSRDHPIKMD